MKKSLLVIMLLVAAVAAKAEVEFAYDAGAELVSAYIWRGQYNGGLSFQPDLEIGFDAADEAISFRAGVWGNIGASDWMFKKDKGDDEEYTYFMPELDVVLSLSAFGASVGFNHYYYCDGSNFFSWHTADQLAEEEGNTSTTEFWFGYNFDHFFGAMPTALTIFSTSMMSVSTPPKCLPVPGLGWWPVMAVVRLSRMTMVYLWLLNLADISEGIPEWKNVESPRKAMAFWSVVSENPPAAPAPPPIQMMKSASLNGG